jgi:hypothetical protein
LHAHCCWAGWTINAASRTKAEKYVVPPVFVIDDFLRNPEEVRAQALSMEYAVQGRYPG